MDEIEIVGQVIGGKIGDIVIREKSGKNLEIGDLIVSEEENSFLILLKEYAVTACEFSKTTIGVDVKFFFRKLIIFVTER